MLAPAAGATTTCACVGVAPVGPRHRAPPRDHKDSCRAHCRGQSIRTEQQADAVDTRLPARPRCRWWWRCKGARAVSKSPHLTPRRALPAAAAAPGAACAAHPAPWPPHSPAPPAPKALNVSGQPEANFADAVSSRVRLSRRRVHPIKTPRRCP